MNNQDQNITSAALIICLARTVNRIENLLSSLMEPHGITLQQYNILRILRGAGEPLPTMEIQNRMIQQTPAITRLIDTLEKKNFVLRTRSKGDRRQIYIEITPEGKKFAEALKPKLENLEDEIAGCLGNKDKVKMHKLLCIITERAEQIAKNKL